MVGKGSDQAAVARGQGTAGKEGTRNEGARSCSDSEAADCAAAAKQTRGQISYGGESGWGYG